jgi:hypothetical protein
MIFKKEPLSYLQKGKLLIFFEQDKYLLIFKKEIKFEMEKTINANSRKQGK